MNDNFDYDILIIGGYGHIGLPMGIVLADCGFQVALYDIDKSKEPMIRAGEMPFLEYDAEPILKRVIGKTLHLADDLSAVAKSRSLVITIGTPLDEYMNPKLLPMFQLIDDLTPYLQPGHHIILRSTVYPGTTKRLHDYLTGLGHAVELSFCPERIAQGYAIREYAKLPQIISGFSQQAIDQSVEIFKATGQTLIVVEVLEAELTKLFSNAWRYIQFATANQFYMIAVDNGADFDRIHHALTFGYDRAKDFPTPGFAAGPCLLKDTMQLTAFYKNNFQLGHNAMLINEGLPAFLVDTLQQEYDLTQETVGILGMAFKADVDDIRDALSYKLGKLLRFHGANVLYSDEFAQDPTFISKEDLVAQSSIVIVGVPHSAYRTLDIPNTVHLVDIWGLFSKNGQ
ncbi:MAG: nucleotide sugar dehydrogenase [Anaerolineales bacterium]